MWDTGQQLFPILFVKIYFEKEDVFPTIQTLHYRHYMPSDLVAEIAYPLLKDNKQLSRCVNLICFPGEGKIITWK